MTRAGGMEHRREGPVVTVAAMKDVVSKLGAGRWQAPALCRW